MNRAIGIISLAILTAGLPAWAMPVSVAGNEWLQPSKFTGLSWNDVNEKCNVEAGGLCDGSLLVDGNEIDVSGYQWASSGEVFDMFRSLVIVDGVLPPGALAEENFWLTGGDSSWATDILNSYTPTASLDDEFRLLNGWTNGLGSEFEGGFGPGSVAGIGDSPPDDGLDIAASSFEDADERVDENGVWLFRLEDPSVVAAVPNPATYALLIAGLVLIRLTTARPKR